MKFSRRIAIATALLALAATTLVACGKPAVTGSSAIGNIATSGVPSGSPTPSVAPPPPPPTHSGGGHGSTSTGSPSSATTVTATVSGHPTLIIRTGIHVLIDYSIVATGNCFWQRSSGNVLRLGAEFTIARGTFGGATVPLAVKDDKTSDQLSVNQPVNTTFPVELGSTTADQNNPFLNTTVTLTATISPTLDDNAADNVATVSIFVPNYADMLTKLSIGGSSEAVTCSF
jgi:hypothetical protein